MTKQDVKNMKVGDRITTGHTKPVIWELTEKSWFSATFKLIDDGHGGNLSGKLHTISFDNAEKDYWLSLFTVVPSKTLITAEDLRPGTVLKNRYAEWTIISNTRMCHNEGHTADIASADWWNELDFKIVVAGPPKVTTREETFKQYLADVTRPIYFPDARHSFLAGYDAGQKNAAPFEALNAANEIIAGLRRELSAKADALTASTRALSDCEGALSYAKARLKEALEKNELAGTRAVQAEAKAHKLERALNHIEQTVKLSRDN